MICTLYTVVKTDIWVKQGGQCLNWTYCHAWGIKKPKRNYIIFILTIIIGGSGRKRNGITLTKKGDIMRYHCNECGCEFYYYMNFTFENIICPQCKDSDIRSIDEYRDATND